MRGNKKYGWFGGDPVLATAPASYEALREQAASALGKEDFEGAVDMYDRAIALDPLPAEAYYKRGNALRQLGRLDAAIESYSAAIARKSDYSYAYCNRGVVQQSLGLRAEALTSYERAIALDPADAMAHYNRALLLQESLRWDEALDSYDRAIAINPGYADAQYNRSLTLLYCGDFERGWQSYEWRWKLAERLSIGKVRDFAQPLWLGKEPLAGKRILLHSEGGLGDTIQFCRYAPLVAAQGATVYLEIQKPLLALLGNLKGVARWVAQGGDLPVFDFHCPLMSLPLAFNTAVPTVPVDAGYLRADPQRVAQWKARLGKRDRPRVGLVWSGNPNNTIDSRRTIRLADWVAHLPPECRYFCLQKDVREEDQETLLASSLIRTFDDDELGFVDTAALCACMDLVISVDTSIAHLSGALGRPTWILLSLIPDWRWLADRDDSPWYPTAKLYRQRTAGDWTAVFERVAADLRREFSAG